MDVVSANNLSKQKYRDDVLHAVVPGQPNHGLTVTVPVAERVAGCTTRGDFVLNGQPYIQAADSWLDPPAPSRLDGHALTMT